ncbi:MAG: histone deacetylase family protein [Cyanobacteria bacterium P01_H01_bin.119]
MITVYSDRHYHQQARAELMDGKLMPPVEIPLRAETVLSAIQRWQPASVVRPSDFGLGPILRVHRSDYVAFLQGAWDEWAAEHGTDQDALPLNWVVRTLGCDRVPDAIDGKLGYYSFDAGTPITAGTWQAITAAANVVLSAQQRIQTGDRSAFALCRPPGHHAGADFFGGYCFLNNAGIAAQAFLDGGAKRAAILDVDYHHGNGTQAIFYNRADVLMVSIHADPKQDYPYFSGYADETGTGAGAGYTFNYPLSWGTSWTEYREALTTALTQIRLFAPDALVVSLGVDTFAGDPISRFQLQALDFEAMGAAIATLKCPTLFTLEGGYAIDAIGDNVVRVLRSFEANHR